MTIPKRNKRNKGGIAKSLPPLETKDIQFAPADKMVRNYPRVCPSCNRETYSARCGWCGRITVINK